MYSMIDIISLNFWFTNPCILRRKKLYQVTPLNYIGPAGNAIFCIYKSYLPWTNTNLYICMVLIMRCHTFL